MDSPGEPKPAGPLPAGKPEAAGVLVPGVPEISYGLWFRRPRLKSKEGVISPLATPPGVVIGYLALLALGRDHTPRD